jgi:hypothetical protein
VLKSFAAMQGEAPSDGAVTNLMTHAFVIQIAGQTAGIVARDHTGQTFRFFASHPTFHPLEGVCFAEPAFAERAARRLFRSRRSITSLDLADLTVADCRLVAVN